MNDIISLMIKTKGVKATVSELSMHLIAVKAGADRSDLKVDEVVCCRHGNVRISTIDNCPTIH